MKTNIRYALSALVLCIGAFLTPATVFAAEKTDATPPRVSAEATDGMLHIEATDDDSGVEAVYIAGKRVNYRVDGALDLDFEDFAPDGQETVEVYAIDFAGNQSDAVTVANPRYQAPEPEPEQKPDCELIGQDGNIFNLMGIASKTLKKNGMKEQAEEMVKRITQGAHNYSEALCIIGEYVNITGPDEEPEDGMGMEM